MADLMQQARELLPCPFCGNTVQDDEGCFQSAGFRPLSTAVWSVRCGNPSCNADVSGTSADDAVDAWNRRPALRAAPEGGVPERTMMALATGWRRHAASGGRGRAVLIQCAESLEAAVIAARPQGVKDA